LLEAIIGFKGIGKEGKKILFLYFGLETISGL
jgi:hypothetical protein